MDDRKEKIRIFIVKNILNESDRDNISDDLDMIASGLLDSLAIVQLIRFMESTFAITISEADVDPVNFSCLNALSRFISKKQLA